MEKRITFIQILIISEVFPQELLFSYWKCSRMTLRKEFHRSSDHIKVLKNSQQLCQLHQWIFTNVVISVTYQCKSYIMLKLIQVGMAASSQNLKLKLFVTFIAVQFPIQCPLTLKITKTVWLSNLSKIREHTCIIFNKYLSFSFLRRWCLSWLFASDTAMVYAWQTISQLRVPFYFSEVSEEAPQAQQLLTKQQKLDCLGFFVCILRQLLFQLLGLCG